MIKKFCGKNIHECLKRAEAELNLAKDKITYNILKESKTMFHKYCEIEVQVEDQDSEEVQDKIDKVEDTKEINEEVTALSEELVEIKDDRIILKTDEGRSFDVQYDYGLGIKINGVDIEVGEQVSSKDVITYTCSNINGKREMKIKATEMEVSITTSYSSPLVGKVSAKIKDQTLHLKLTMKEEGEVPYYTKKEVIEAINERNIVFGLIDEGINEVASQKAVSNIVVAKGIKVIDDEKDELKVYFETTKKEFEENSRETIDYRNINSIANVAANSVIAEIKIGKEGTDGTNVYGNTIARKLKKSLQLNVGVGCKIEGNKVISTIEGQPSIKGSLFNVHQVFETNNDVDLKSGNIKFIGDVKIAKNVMEGMVVEAGNSVEILGNVEQATIVAQGTSQIKGSILNSKISIGSADMMIQKKLHNLEAIDAELGNLTVYMEELKNKNLFPDKSDGELIKALIDSKFKNIPSLVNEILSKNGEEKYEEIKAYLRNKIVGLGSLSIKYFNELYSLKDMIKEETDSLKQSLLVSADLHINYVQDSEINVTGNIYIDGKGQYTSRITAQGDIVFSNSTAVSRGGELRAGGNIYAKILGSSAGVSTILRVQRDKVITANIAYNNTTFYFGERKYTLEDPSKNVKAYCDEKGEIVVEKLML